MRRLDMGPDNNESDACDGGDTLQDVPSVDDCQRKTMFSTIMTCLLTWYKQGQNWFEKLSEMFWATYLLQQNKTKTNTSHIVPYAVWVAGTTMFIPGDLSLIHISEPTRPY